MNSPPTGLILVFLVLAGLLVKQHYYGLAAACVLVAVFSLVRYFHKIRKATETTYKYVAFLENRYLLADDNAGVDESNMVDKEVLQPPDKYAESIKHVITGFTSHPRYWEMDGDSDWHSRDPGQHRETLLCLEGRGWLSISADSDSPENIIWLSPNACIDIPAGQKLKVKNTGVDRLSLVSIPVE